MDVTNKTLKAVDHNRYKVLAIVVALVMSAVFYGCKPVTVSPVSGEKVTATELQMEVVNTQGDFDKRKIELDSAIEKYDEDVRTFNSQITAAENDLKQQYETRKKIAQFVGDTIRGVSSGQIDVAGVAGSAALLGLTLFSGGAVLDGRRKDKIIKEVKENG